jgi:gliding motility-associated-like protein
MTSPNGINWTNRLSEPNEWRGLTYGNGLFVAVARNGNGNRVMTSPDGITWTPRTSAADNDWFGVTYGSGLFVAVATNGNGNRVMTSPDGINWTARTSAANNEWISVTYGNGLFTAVSSNGTGNQVMTSPDGITWTAQTSAVDNNWRSVTYGNGLFVAVSGTGTGNRVMTSNAVVSRLTIDAIASQTYTGSALTPAIVVKDGATTLTLGTHYSVAYSNNTNAGTATVTITGMGNYLGTKTQTFAIVKPASTLTIVPIANQTYTGAALTPTVVVIDGATTLTLGTDYTVAYTANTDLGTATVTITGLGNYTGTNTQTFTITNWAARTSAADSDWYNVTYGNGLFVAIAGLGAGSQVMTSPDGFAWTAQTSPAGSDWYSITYGNGLFVAVAFSGTNQVMTSPDGINWTVRTAAAYQWRSVTYGNGLFVAVASSGSGDRVMTSPDGITWTSRASAEDNNWGGVTYGNGVFVAVAFDGTNRVMTSSDGITWTAQTAAVNNAWYGLTYGKGLFVATAVEVGPFTSGSGNRVMTSPDGITWTARTSAEDNTWYTVTYGNGIFVALSDNGTNRVMTSPDGITWTAEPAAVNNSWNGITYGNGLFVAVSSTGEDDRVMTSNAAVSRLTIDAIANQAYTGSALTPAIVVKDDNTTLTLGTHYSVAYTANTNVGTATVTITGMGNFLGTKPETFVIARAASSLTIDPIANQTYTGAALTPAVVVKDGAMTLTLGTDYTVAYSNNTNVGTAMVIITGIGTFAGTKTQNFTIEAKAASTLTIDPIASLTYTGAALTPGIVVKDGANTLTLGTDYTVAYSNNTNEGIATVTITGMGNYTGTKTQTFGITNWIVRTSAADNFWFGVTYGNGLFVAVAGTGSGNRVMTSPDGITWTARTSAADNQWWGITYGNGLFVAVARTGTGNRVMTSPDGITWTIRTSAANNKWNAVTYGNGLFVAVAGTVGSGTGNRVMTSPDGITWTSQTSVPDSDWYSVTYGNGLFVAVDFSLTGNRVMTSPDGITWTAQTSAANNQWSGVTYGNGLFVAVAYGGTGNRVMTSPDGITWTSQTSAPQYIWRSVIYANGLFVAVSDNFTGVNNNQVMTSPDGITWTSQTTPVNNNWVSVTYGNGLFVSVAYAGTGNRVMTSNAAVSRLTIDAIANQTYTGSALTPAIVVKDDAMTLTLGTHYSVAYTANTNVGTATVTITGMGNFAGTKAQTFAIVKAASSLTIDPIANQTYTGAALTPPVSVKDGATTLTLGTDYTVAYTANTDLGMATVTITGLGTYSGTKTQTFEIVAWASRTSAADNNWYGVAYGNGVFVAVASSGTGNRVMSSPDGITWTARASAADNVWWEITFGNGLFVAVANTGTGNRVMTSPDGITWTARSSAADNNWRNVVYGNGVFVAIAATGTGNRVMTSPDGISWTLRTSAADNNWYNVTFGNGVFVAVSTSGTGNRVMTSPDGITWTARSSAADNNWGGLAYGNGVFVAVSTSGTGNRVMTSPDGITWTLRTSAEDNNWYSLTYGNGIFVAVSDNGTNRVMTSPDGITWTAQKSIVNNNWYGLTYGNGLFVAVAGSGTGNRVMTLNAAVSRLTIEAIANQSYTGAPLTPVFVVKDGSTTLTLGTHYSVAYSNNTNVGTATVMITGMGNYIGTKSETFSIVAKAASTLSIDPIPNQTYTGAALTPAAVVKDGATTLNQGTDYTIAYSNNTNVGTATVTITGMGVYMGTKTQTFAIVSKAVSTLTIDPIANQNFTGTAITPTVVVKEGAMTLTLGTDYTVAYSNNTNVGTAIVTITGIGTYVGTKTQPFTIVSKAVSSLTIDPIANQTYTGSALTPAIVVKDGATTLTLGTDYTVAYSNNSNVGTAIVVITGTGNYMGTKAQTFAIVAKSASTLSIDAIASQTYTGSGITPTPVVKDGSTTLTLGMDFTIAYSNNTNVGTATVTITGVGNYTGTTTQTFVIVAKAASTLIIDAIANQTYTGSAITPTPVVKDGSATLTLGTDYTVAYMSNTNAGTATVTVTGMGNYSGDNPQTFTIVPKALILRANNTSKIYGDANPSFNFSYSGLVDGDTEIDQAPSISTSATTTSRVGTYPITLTGGSDPNYSLTLEEGALEVSPAPLSLAVNAATKIYGQVDPVYTYGLQGLKGSDTDVILRGAFNREAGENPGTYRISQGSISAGANYNLTVTGAILQILKARALSVVELEQVTTEWSKEAALPATVNVLSTHGQYFRVEVKWDKSKLNLLARGTYSLTGNLILPVGIENPDQVLAKIQVQVLPKAAPRDVTITNTTFVGSTTVFFIPVGAFVVNDPVDKIHVVSFLGEGYDNKYFYIQNNVLYWNSAERAPGKTTFSIVVRVTDRDGNTLDKFFEIRRTRPEFSSGTIYNSFTPNGDRFNDTWGAPEIRFYEGVRISVYDRGGARVFYTENPDVRWDGTSEGKELPIGTYFWVIEIKETGETRRGMLNLIRK